MCVLRVRPAAGQSSGEVYGVMGGHNDSYGNSSQDSTLMMREVSHLSLLTPDPWAPLGLLNTQLSILACTRLCVCLSV